MTISARNIQDGNSRKIVMLALGADDRWLLSRSGGGHGVLTWWPTGERVIFSITHCDQAAWKHLADDIERVSGIVTRQRVKRKARVYVPPKPQPAAQRMDGFAAIVAARRVAKDADRQRMARAEHDAREWAREREYRDLMQPGR